MQLGQPIKTVVSPAVLDAVATGDVKPTKLEWQGPVKGKVGNGQAVFYTMDVSQARTPCCCLLA